MNKSKSLWLAIGKQAGKYETKSQLLPSFRRNSSVFPSQEQDSSLLKNHSLQYFVTSANKPLKQANQQISHQIINSKDSSFQLRHKQFLGICEQEQNSIFYNKQKFNNKLLNTERIQRNIMELDNKYNPFYISNNLNKNSTHKQSLIKQNAGSDKISDKVDQMYESIIDDHQGNNSDRNSNDSFGINPNIINVDSSQSQIIQSISFVQQANKSPVINFQRLSVDQNIFYEKYKIQKFPKIQSSHNQKSQKICVKVQQLQQIAQQLKTVLQSIMKQILTCQSTGQIPLFISNKSPLQKIFSQLQQILSRTQNFQCLQNQNNSESFVKVLNNYCQQQVLDSSFRELSNGKMLQKMMKNVQQKQNQIIRLQQKLNQKQQQINQKQTILISKLQLINQLHEQLSLYKDSHQNKLFNQVKNQNTMTPQIQRLLRQKQIKNLELSRQIQLLKQKNQQISNQKQCLQQQIFTLQQKIIGVEMQVQQKVRKGIQEISFAIEQKVRKQFKTNSQREKSNYGKNQCYIQTIDTLSRQITDLTDKCKSYQKYVREQQKTIASSKGIVQNKEYEQLLQKRYVQLESKQTQLANLQNQLLFRDKKLKDFEGRLNKQAGLVQNEKNILIQKQQEILKYQSQLNAKEEDLYMWEKSLKEQDKALNRKITQFQRNRSIYQSQIVNYSVGISPHPVTQHNMNRGGLVSPSANGYSVVSPRVVNQHQPYYQGYIVQPKVYYDRSDHILTQNPQQFYQPTYQQSTPMIDARNISKRNSNYPIDAQIRYSKEQRNYNSQDQNPQCQSGIHNKNNNKTLQLNSSFDQTKKFRTQSIKIRPGSALNQNYQQNYNTFSQQQNYPSNQQNQLNLQNQQNQQSNYQTNNRQQQNPKLYHSTIQDRKSQVVEQILARRKNQPNRNQNKNINKGPLQQIFGRSQLKRIKSPINGHTKQTMQQRLKQHRQKFESRKVFQKPSKDLPQMYRSNHTSSNMVTGKKPTYDVNRDISGYTDKSYTTKSFSKSNAPGAIHINQKLQKLKQQIKRQVKALQ